MQSINDLTGFISPLIHIDIVLQFIVMKMYAVGNLLRKTLLLS
jgi:hypothetical protein